MSIILIGRHIKEMDMADKCIKFKETKAIIKRKNEINELKNLLTKKETELKAIVQKQFDKQTGLTVGKSIVLCDCIEYLYMGLKSPLYIQDGDCVNDEKLIGCRINRNGLLSKYIENTYFKWIKLKKEYTNK